MTIPHKYQWSFDGHDTDDIEEDFSDGKAKTTGPIVEVLDEDKRSGRVFARPKTKVSLRRKFPNGRHSTVLDLNTACDWNIAGMDVTIPMAREESTAGSRKLLKNNDSKINSDPGDSGNGADTETKIESAALVTSSSSYTTSFSSSTYTAYVIRIVAGRKVWHVSHRYSDFVELHQSLRETIDKSILPRLPGKHILRFNNKDPTFVEKRRKGLEVYLRAVVRIESAWSSPYLVHFLDNNSETLSLQNKYERMMRVQGVLIRASQMNSRRNAATERALKKSMHEVASLKARLEQLEAHSKEVEKRAAEQARQKEEDQKLREQQMMERIQQQVAQQFRLQQEAQQKQVHAQRQTRRQGEQHQDNYYSGSLFREDPPNHVTSPFEISTLVDNFPGSILSSASHLAIDSIMPSKEAEEKRDKVVNFISKLVGTSLGIEVFQTGSFPTKTYLPNSDLDMTVCTGSMLGDEWFRKLHDALLACSRSSERVSDISEEANNSNQLVVRNTMWINADVKLIKCVIDNISVDITAGQFPALATAQLVEMVSRRFGCEHIFKRSLLMIKAWLSFDAMKLSRMESSGFAIYGSDRGGLSTYSLVVMLMMLFNTHPQLATLESAAHDGEAASTIISPIHVLSIFLDIFSEWQWGLHCVSIFGAVHAYTEELANASVSVATADGRCACLLPLERQRFDSDMLSELRALEIAFRSDTKSGEDPLEQKKAEGQVSDAADNSAVGSTSSSGQLRTQFFDTTRFQCSSCMVIDPVNRANNVARAISRENLNNLTLVLRNGKQILIHALQRASQSLTTLEGSNGVIRSIEIILRTLFPVSHMKFRKMRPDLLVHPRQTLRQVQKDVVDLRSIVLSHQQVHQASSRYDILNGNFKRLCGTLEYVKLIAGTSWTKETLHSVLLQMIHGKPADLVLPVGEIGKMLQSKTRNPVISSEIKERFGGLKKFLSGCEGIVVHDDHPFNPSVSVDGEVYNKLKSSGSLYGIQVGVALTQGLSNTRDNLAFGSGRSRKKRSNRKKRNRGNKHVVASVQPDLDETLTKMKEDEWLDAQIDISTSGENLHMDRDAKSHVDDESVSGSQAQRAPSQQSKEDAISNMSWAKLEGVPSKRKSRSDGSNSVFENDDFPVLQ